MINFYAPAEDAYLIEQIAKRVVSYYKTRGSEYPAGVDMMRQEMNLTACHMNGMPLNLHAMLDADDYNLMHDIVGIEQHINRITGKIDGLFLPRFSR